MRISFLTAFVTALLSVSAFAQAPNPAVNGTIKSFDGKTLSLETGGAVMTAQVTSTTRIIMNVRKTIADIKPGDFIASGGTRGPDGKLRANEIRIFTAPGGEGQFPMAQPGQTMTNATVEQVVTGATVQQVGSGAAPVIKLTFHGAGASGSPNCTGRAADAPGGAGTGCVGETQFEVPADVPIVAQMPGDPTMLKPGSEVSVTAAKAADGSATATRITISQ
jgi:hypothetical protein